MKRLHILMIIALAVVVSFSSCSKKHKREKITDPVQQEALRTRNEDIPIDSLFTAKAAREIASPFKKIAIGKLFSEIKASWPESAEKAAREKYAEKLHKKDKMKEDEAQKAAAKASTDVLAEFEPSTTERLEATFKFLPGEGYSPTLTIYFFVMLIAFAIIFTIKVIKAFFISPK